MLNEKVVSLNYNEKMTYDIYEKSDFNFVNDEIHSGIQKVLFQLELDVENYGTKQWNPFKNLVKENGKVIIKPNLVSHINPANKSGDKQGIDCLITHKSIIREIAEYVAKGMNGIGIIIVGDCPIQDTNWQVILKLIEWDRIKKFFAKKYPKITIIAKDYRLDIAKKKGKRIIKRIENKKNLSSYTEVDLKDHSLLIPLMRESIEFGVSRYSRNRMKSAHNQEVNKYIFPNDIFDSDLIINLPKMKTHMKAGITGALKNLIGINGRKDYLPHFRYGSPKNGGDEYPNGGKLWDIMWFFAHKDWDLDKGIMKWFYGFIFKIFLVIQILSGKNRRFANIGGGSWYGNDTLWRTILDINRAFFYYNFKEKKMDNEIQRNYLVIMDGIISGHKESPLTPSPIMTHILLASFNPVALDTIVSALMGFDFKKIPQIYQAYNNMKYPLVKYTSDEILIRSEKSEIKDINSIYMKKNHYNFQPSLGYKNHIEYNRLNQI